MSIESLELEGPVPSPGFAGVLEQSASAATASVDDVEASPKPETWSATAIDEVFNWLVSSYMVCMHVASVFPQLV